MKLFKVPGMQISEIEEMMGEAIILSKIGHPNIIRVFDANVFDVNGANHGYFTMENVAGVAPLPWKKVLPRFQTKLCSLPKRSTVSAPTRSRKRLWMAS